jgi:gamma-glutamylcyclotransferase
MKQVLVFSYGSNLNERQMRARCPSARIEARAVLPDHALAFGGYSHRWRGAVASIVPEPGSRVEGLIYRIDAPELAALDRHEGHPFMYERKAKLVTDETRRRRRAHVYQQPADVFEPWLPQPDYFRVLLCAYKRLGFDVAPLATAVGVAS